MNCLDIVLTGVGLSMDAVTVAVSNGLVYAGLPARKQAAMPLLFGLFQMLMPLTGYWVGGLFSLWLDRCAQALLLLIFGGIGGKMVWDGLHPDETGRAARPGEALSWPLLAAQAMATSMDAFTVGVGFSAVGVAIVPAAALIGVITSGLCCLAVGAGRAFGAVLEDRAQLAGGLLLLALGLKTLISGGI